MGSGLDIFKLALSIDVPVMIVPATKIFLPTSCFTCNAPVRDLMQRAGGEILEKIDRV